MSDIFVSYDRRDQEIAQDFVSSLSSLGFRVSWDQDIPIGSDYEASIRKFISDAKVVLVLWSDNSVDSHGVKSEVEKSRQYQLAGNEKLIVGVMISPALDLPIFVSMEQALPFYDLERGVASAASWPRLAMFLAKNCDASDGDVKLDHQYKSESTRESDLASVKKLPSRALGDGKFTRGEGNQNRGNIFASRYFALCVFIISAIVSTMATFTGLYTFSRVEFSWSEFNSQNIVVFAMLAVVVSLTLGMMLIVNWLSMEQKIGARIASIGIYLVAVMFSVGFGYAFYWSFFAAPAAAEQEIRRGAVTLRASFTDYQEKITSFGDAVALVGRYSSEKQAEETSFGGSCDGDLDPRPGFGPRARERQSHSQEVAQLVASIEREWLEPSIGRMTDVSSQFRDLLDETKVRLSPDSQSKLDSLDASLSALAVQENTALRLRQEALAGRMSAAAARIRDNRWCSDEELSRLLESSVQRLSEISEFRSVEVYVPTGAEAVSLALEKFWLNAVAIVLPLELDEETRNFEFQDIVALFVAIMVDLGLLVSGVLYSRRTRYG